MRTEWFFYQNLGLTKVFHQTVGSPLIKRIHNESMYVRFGGMRDTKTWSKSTMAQVNTETATPQRPHCLALSYYMTITQNITSPTQSYSEHFGLLKIWAFQNIPLMRHFSETIPIAASTLPVIMGHHLGLSCDFDTYRSHITMSQPENLMWHNQIYLLCNTISSNNVWSLNPEIFIGF